MGGGNPLPETVIKLQQFKGVGERYVSSSPSSWITYMNYLNNAMCKFF